MKRVKAVCVFQTLVFFQKEDCGLSKELHVKNNHEDVEKYKNMLIRAGTRYRIVEEAEQPDGSVIVKVRKQYSDHADVGEYFDM